MSEKFIDLSASAPEEGLNGFRGAIAESNPKNLRWMPLQETPLTEVSVFGYDGEAVLGSIGPDRRVFRFAQPDIPNMNAVGETISQLLA
jgi:hypothetical protein